MTVSTTVNTVVYRGNGATTDFAVPFKVLDVDHLVVTRRVFATGADDHTYIGTDYDYAGIGDPSGTLTLDGTALDSDFELVIERIVPYTQDLDIVNAGGFYPETVENQLDLMVMATQQLVDLSERGIKVPVGEDGLTLPSLGDRAGKYLAFDAQSAPVAASGTGTDAGLRSDLAAESGASLVGTPYGGFLLVIDRFRSADYEQAMTWPSGADMNCRGVIPNSSAPATSILMRLPRNRYIVRILRSNGVIEEFIFRDVGTTYPVVGPVGGGWIMIGHTSYFEGEVYRWLVQPEDLNYCTNPHWALRLGQDAALDGSNYAAINANAIGQLHGNMTLVPDPVMTADGGGTNLYLSANLPAGESASAAQFVLSTTYHAQLPGGAVLAATLTDTVVMNTASGFLNELSIDAAVANLVLQDSPIGMVAFTPNDLGANTVKMEGSASFTPDGTGETGSSLFGFNVPGRSVVTTRGQAYDINRSGVQVRNSQVIKNAGNVVTPPIQNTARNLTAWQHNTLGVEPHWYITDTPEMFKFYAFAAPTAIAPLVGMSIPMGNTHYTYYQRSTEVGALI